MLADEVGRLVETAEIQLGVGDLVETAEIQPCPMYF